MKIQIITLKLLLIYLLHGASLPAQNDGFFISGTILDATTQEPVIAATVSIKGTVTGTLTDAHGSFTLQTRVALPLVLRIETEGYEPLEYVVQSVSQPVRLQLSTRTVLMNNVVVTASRVEEKVLESPVSIQKLDIRAIQESPAPSFFDAIEALQGIQMTTLSLGFKVPNTRGFGNTTNARFLQMVDGADTQAPGLGVSIANTVGPTELDVLSVEVTPGASSALYGMNSLNGLSNVQTKNPFYHQGLSFYQKAGFNHLGSPHYGAQPFTETALRYARALNSRWAFKLNVGYLRGTDWVASDTRDLNSAANPTLGLAPADSPAQDPLNSYGNESSNRRTLTLADGRRHEVRRTGYFEKDLVNRQYGVENLKADVAIHHRFAEKWEASLTYRLGKTDAIYQRGNRIRLDDYWIHQQVFTLKGKRLTTKAYATQEFTENSYNLRPMGENMDNAFKRNDLWFADYSAAFNTHYTQSNDLAASHRQARAAADAGRYQPGTAAFDQTRDRLAGINDWDQGAQILLRNHLYNAEAQYDLKELIKPVDILLGVDYRVLAIFPDGNHFFNPNPAKANQRLLYAKYGGFVQLTRRFIHDKLKLTASARVDKNDYFTPRFNPRVSAVHKLNERHFLRATYQNGFRFPTLFEGFSAVNNGGVIRYGGLPVMSQGLFENSYVRSSVDAFQRAINADVNGGKALDQAIVDNQGLLRRNTYTYLEPEKINALDIGYKGSWLDDRLFVDLEAYYNVYSNFIDQIEIAVPNEGNIGHLENGVDSTIFQMENTGKQTRYRMWTNSKSNYINVGATAGFSYNFYKDWLASVNFTFARLEKVIDRDDLETAFNTPQYLFNVSLGNRNLYKNLGFNVTWRWQDAFAWRSPLGDGVVPAYNAVDAQLNYRLTKQHTTIKLGATNLLNTYYTQYIGGPAIGGFYYASVTIDGLLSGAQK